MVSLAGVPRADFNRIAAELYLPLFWISDDATPGELTTDELRAGGEQLRMFVRRHAPRVVAVAGITAYRAAFSLPKATMGEQPEPFEGSRLFVVPNPSGLNAHETTSSLAESYRRAALAAGVVR